MRLSVVITFIVADCIERLGNICQSRHREGHRSCRVASVKAESTVNLSDVEEVTRVPFRIKNAWNVILEQSGETFIQPGKKKKIAEVRKLFKSSLRSVSLPSNIPPFASDSISKELMAKLVSDDINSTQSQ